MATKAVHEKDKLLETAADAIEIFKNYIEHDDYVVELNDTIIAVRGNAVKAYLSRYSLSITYGDIDIVYKFEKTQILIFDKTTFKTTRYDAPELHYIMSELHGVLIKKVKERLEKSLKEL